MGSSPAKRPRLEPAKGAGASAAAAVGANKELERGHDSCAHVWQEAGDGQPGRVCNQCGLYNSQTELRGDEEVFNENFAKRSRIDHTDPASEVRAMTRHAASIRGKFSAKEGLTTEDLRAIRTADALAMLTTKVTKVLEALGQPATLASPIVKGLFVPSRNRALVAKRQYKLAQQSLPPNANVEIPPVHDQFLVRESVRWGTAADALAAACTFAVLAENGCAPPFPVVAERMGAQQDKARRKYKMLCKCHPTRYSSTGLIDQHVYLPYFFEKLAEHQSQGFRRIKAAQTLKDKLNKANFGEVKALARRLADWMPSSVVHGTSQNYNHLFDPWSTTIAIAAIALEARGSVTTRKAFTSLALLVIADHQVEGSSTSAAQCGAKSAQMMAYIKEQLHLLRSTDINETSADKRARLARAQRARLKSTTFSVSEKMQDCDRDGEKNVISAGAVDTSASQVTEASDLPTAAQVCRHLDELLCASGQNDHVFEQLGEKKMCLHSIGQQEPVSQADLEEEGEEVVGDIDVESVHGYSEEDDEDESDFV